MSELTTEKELVCVSGPHGGGKTTLIDRAIQTDAVFKHPQFEIDFLSEFSSFASLEDWERSLIRLYHRIFTSSLTVDNEKSRTVLVSRGVLDSEAYIEAYYRLGWIDKPQYSVLARILEVVPFHAPTVVLVPPLVTLKGRLRSRIESKQRENRDVVFKREDQDDFIDMLHAVFLEFSTREYVLLLDDNEESDISRLRDWVRN